MDKKQRILSKIYACLAMSMVIVLWVVFMDGVLFGEWKFIKVISSIVLGAILFYMIHKILEILLDAHPVLEIILEYLSACLVFVLFGYLFQWYDKINIYVVMAYTIPIYVASYLLRLSGIHKDADYINNKLKERKKLL